MKEYLKELNVNIQDNQKLLRRQKFEQAEMMASQVLKSLQDTKKSMQKRNNDLRDVIVVETTSEHSDIGKLQKQEYS